MKYLREMELAVRGKGFGCGYLIITLMYVKTQLEDLQNYLTDASNVAGGTADRLLIPESVDEVADVLRDANSSGTPVTISGARTGTVGGAVPFGGIVIALERINKIVDIDQETLTAVVQPGVVLADLQKAANEARLFYPPDPTEWSCQIGGTIATNASGARSFKYGSTRDYVRRLKVVLADGDTVEVRRGDFVSDGDGQLRIPTARGRTIECRVPTYDRPDVRKNVSGYFNEQPLDAVDLFVGSEGTLGVIVEAELVLLPRPKGLFGGIVFFESESDLLTAVCEIRSLAQGEGASLDPTLLEFFDGNSLKLISEKFPETPAEAACALFFEQETTGDNEDDLLETWNEVLERNGANLDTSWFTTTEPDRERMRAFRHALPVAVNERIVRYGQRKVGTDMAVPDSCFPSFLRFYNDILNAGGIDYVIFGHIGDNHLHANMLPKNDEEAKKAWHIYGRCVAQAIMLGGTASAEHGIGKLKRKYLSAMMGERYLNEMADLKRAFDPKGILSRGNIFEESYLL